MADESLLNDEAELVRLYRRLDHDKRGALLALVRTVAPPPEPTLGDTVKVKLRTRGFRFDPQRVSGGLLTPSECRSRLGMARSAFDRAQKAGELRRLEVRHPFGKYRYSAQLVDAFLAGKSVAYHGRRVTTSEPYVGA